MHVLIAVFLIGVVLLQRSEGGALGIGGGTGGVMTGRGAANLLTRTTAILAAAFFATSIALALVSGLHSAPTSILDTAVESETGDGDVPQGSSEPAAPLSTQ